MRYIVYFDLDDERGETYRAYWGRYELNSAPSWVADHRKAIKYSTPGQARSSISNSIMEKEARIIPEVVDADGSNTRNKFYVAYNNDVGEPDVAVFDSRDLELVIEFCERVDLKVLSLINGRDVSLKDIKDMCELSGKS